jgi:leader peptidase (prepilin peptidase)/N-methyltransferase
MIVFYAAIGLVVGAILNVLADNLPQRARPRPPVCVNCGIERPPVAWLTSLGYLVQGGRCVNCGQRLPLRGLLVELTTMVVFVLLYQYYGLTPYMLLLSVYMAILILVTVTDLEHRLILNWVILPAIVLALAAAPLRPDLTWQQILVGGVVGFGFFYLIAIIYPGGMGAGDVKLAAFVGLISGFPAVIVALLVTILAGGLTSIFLVVTRIRSMRDAIPYGPFLVIGGIVALFWGQMMVNDYIEQFQDTETEVMARETRIVHISSVDPLTDAASFFE